MAKTKTTRRKTKSTKTTRSTKARASTARKTTARKTTARKTTARKTTAAKATKGSGGKKSAVADKVVSIDQRASKDRRDDSERRQDSGPVAVECRQLERRAKVNRRRQIDPTTCERDYTQEEIEFMRAFEEYKRRSGRMFPTCSEVLEVIRDLGYQKQTPAATNEVA